MMLTEIQDRNEILSNAIEITSAEERDAYIARACGNDAALRRQVETLVAAHFQTRGSGKPALTAGAHLPKRKPEQDSANHAGGRDGADKPVEAAHTTHGTTHGAGKLAAKSPRNPVTAAALLLLGLAIVVGAGMMVWAVRTERQARKTVQEALTERDHAQKAAAEAKAERERAEAVQQTTAKERDGALAAEKAEQHSEEDTNAVLAFLKNEVLSAGRPAGLAGGQGKDVTLRKAVDTAEAEVAKTFADRPLAEASVRETLGSAYLDLGEAALAIKQFERALALRDAMLPEDHPDTVACRNKLAVAYRHAGRTAEASRLYDQNFNSSSHASALAVRGSMLLSQKKPIEAELKLRECLAIRQKIQPDDWTTFEAKSLLGEALLEQKKYADAEPLLLSGYEGMKQHEAKMPSQDKGRLTKALERLVQFDEAQGKKDEAAKWRKELEAAKTAKKP
ncbi:MAG TPA: tetratricopeptide repeat protein [Gemmataceae bacterium]|nr:tetratricopeptide repeat protein [Gemmataceae bacterium]